MRVIPLFGILCFAATGLSRGDTSYGRQKPPRRNRGPATSHGITNKYIIELEQGSDTAGIARHFATKPHNKTKYYREFDCGDLFEGLALETDSENVDTLRAVKGVANVWPLKAVPLESTMKRIKIDPGDPRVYNYSMHQWTGVDKLHEAGIRGKGATVAIIDTGIDYNHNALGGCFGPGCKVSGGYDLVGPTWDTQDEEHYPKLPDADPMDHEGHGTHVAGIIAADNEWLTGVAPDAKLLIYKVFSDSPYDTNEGELIQAFCDAYSTGADVITASIGEPNGFVDNPWALVANRIVDKGVVVTISAGNEGETGAFYAGSGGNGPDVLAVAAVNVTGNTNISTSNERYAPMPGYFTTWGPTNELLMKPDIGAPGWEVISTVLNQGFDEMSGTSMAAPYIAGIAALYIAKHGGRELHGPGFAKMLAKRIASSGRSLIWSADRTRTNVTAPPFQVGTGLIDAWKTLHYDTQLTYEPFALLDTELFRPRWQANITNNGKKPVVYSFDLEPQGAVEIYDSYYGISSLFQMKILDIVPNVLLPSPRKVQPGETVKVEFEFQLPQGVDDDMLPLYGGKVWVRGDNDEDLSIPYGGAAYDTEKAFDTIFAGEPRISDWGNDGRWSFNVEKQDANFIEITTRLAYACTDLRFDIFETYWDEHMWHYPPVVGRFGYIGSATAMRNSDYYWYYDSEKMDKDDTISFPMLRVPRGYGSYWWFGKLANGTQIQPGNYTLRFAALRPYGNPNISDHWDIMQNEVPEIQVLPYNATLNFTQPMRKTT